MTREGLVAVKKLLRKSASKNTSVSCHWVRSRSQSELLWIVGRRNCFDFQGRVPVNTTSKAFMLPGVETDWHYLPLTKAIVALAALLHDWGKASVCFQNKLRGKNRKQGDPLRHEWISCLLFKNLVGDDTDEQWLSRLIAGDFSEQRLVGDFEGDYCKAPLKGLPPVASLVAWLILTHHKLPADGKQNREGSYRLEDYQQLLSVIVEDYGYKNRSDIEVKECLSFNHGLLKDSHAWVRQVKKWSESLLASKALAEQAIQSGVWKVILHHARLSLMLGDYCYSSQDADKNWGGEIDLYANTSRDNRQLKQKLDEHLVGVAKKALHVVHRLPFFENGLPVAHDIELLKKSSQGDFVWQDEAAKKITKWRDSNVKYDERPFGFFCVNMASTGCGKTIANAKMMRSLSPDRDSLRYVLALGLRTLTLQTGDEYRDKIGLDSSELAVIIGSQAVLDLHAGNHSQSDMVGNLEESGSESAEELFEGNVLFDETFLGETLDVLLTKDKEKKILYAPVLACTIDHIMKATETKRGGRYILPSLRLMSSDLVIDEIDDFSHSDLAAITRLIHLAGLFGKKVMISSATITPGLAQGCFEAYQSGWTLFAASRGYEESIGCGWVDESEVEVKSINEQAYADEHLAFVNTRIANLEEGEPKRKLKLVHIEEKDITDEVSIEKHYFETIKASILQMHRDYYGNNRDFSKKNVSFGVVRMANIQPCINLNDYLKEASWPKDVSVKVMAYHSDQVLLMRSCQEKHLDEVLRRKPPEATFENKVIKTHLNQAEVENVIFILVATPVEEVGRDHDFDWAILEPSSTRSIIQLAGRVLRHRAIIPSCENVGILQYNLKGYKGVFNPNKKRGVVFSQPGFETEDTKLESHNLKDLDVRELFQTGVSAIPRIKKKQAKSKKISC
ncbi:type I-F CRISPR-associated helicase Cas3 [Piscirickettsia litoralis]|uniref:Type I-F CRISPR-associated helicase Cas3 n=2 Tax=Piscirickettsia litoralis TaxID=1891921 RepID=A0ABX3A2B1_9GAMM|nr:type I-F CRISPR-associated helicase Cas3 [Piscirickettsia litoralis]